MQRTTSLLPPMIVLATIQACLVSPFAFADERISQVTLFRLSPNAQSLSDSSVGQLATMSLAEVSIEELQKQLAACQAENQLRKDKKVAATSEAIVELSGITNTAKVPDIFTIFGDGAEIRFLTTDAKVTWFPFSTKTSEASSTAQLNPELMTADAAPAAIAIDSQRSAIEIAEKLGSTKGQTQALLLNLLEDLKTAGNDTGKLEQIKNQLNSVLGATTPTLQQQELAAAPGIADCNGQPSSGFRWLCVSGANSGNLTYRQPSVPWSIEYWIDETSRTIHAFAKVTNLTSYTWDKNTIVVLRDTPSSTPFLRFVLEAPLLAEHSGVFPAGSFQYSDEQRVLDVDKLPLQVVRTVIVDGIPEFFPASNTAVYISQLPDGTKIHRKGQVSRVKDASVSFGEDFGLRATTASDLSLSSVESFDGGIISLREKRSTKVKIESDADRTTSRPFVKLKKTFAPNLDASPSPPVVGGNWEQVVQIERASSEVSFVAFSNLETLKKIYLKTYFGTLTENQKKELSELEKLIGVKCNAVSPRVLTASEQRVSKCICLLRKYDEAAVGIRELTVLRSELEIKLNEYDIDTRSPNSQINRLARQSLKEKIQSLNGEIQSAELSIAKLKDELTVEVWSQSLQFANLKTPH